MSMKEIEVTAKEIVSRIGNSSKPVTSTQRSRNTSSSSIKDVEANNAGSPVSQGEAPKPGSERSNSLSKKLSVGSGIGADVQMSAEQKAVEQLLRAVEKWVQEAQQESESDGVRASFKELDNFHWVYSIESYLRSLDTDWTVQQALTNKIASQLTYWLKQLFHFTDNEMGDQFNSIHPHWDINGGLSTMTQLSLHLKFPNLLSLGYQHFQEEGKTPVFYCSDDVLGQQICSKIGLPYKCISVVDFTNKNWVEQFESQVKTDIQNGKIPVTLLMNTAVQNLETGVKVAESYRLWVHFYGNNVLAYFLKRLESSHLGSSFTLDLSRWLKTPKLPYLTLYKRPESIDQKIMELCELGSPRSEIMCFTPWFVAHVFGKTRLSAIVSDAIHRGNFLLEMVQRFPVIVVVPNWSTLSDDSVILSTLTFQFNPAKSDAQRRQPATDDPASILLAEDPDFSPSYLDTLNSWLYHILDRDLKDVLPLEFVYVETRGWNIHVDIIRTRKWTPEDEAKILSTFENHMNVLQATVSQKIKFQKLVNESAEMDWINNENQWAGLGAVRYIPNKNRKSVDHPAAADQNGSIPPQSPPAENSPGPLHPPSRLSEGKSKQEVDHLNAQIVNKLRAIDSAFSLGESPSGEWCVQFGMVTEETDVQELIRLVTATGQEIEENHEFFHKMSELVRKGIHEAEEELRKEREEELWEEGILRRVPIVGTFVSWFSPPSKETGVRGRALNLTQGKVESTENIYKYHMQVKATTFSEKTTEAAKQQQ